MSESMEKSKRFQSNPKASSQQRGAPRAGAPRAGAPRAGATAVGASTTPRGAARPGGSSSLSSKFLDSAMSSSKKLSPPPTTPPSTTPSPLDKQKGGPSPPLRPSGRGSVDQSSAVKTSGSSRDPLMVAMMKAKTRATDEWATPSGRSPGPPGQPAPLGRYNRPTAGYMPPAQAPGVGGSPFADQTGWSTEESIERLRRRHRAEKKIPKRLTETEVDVIVEELVKRRAAQEATDKMLDKTKVSKLLALPDDELLEVMMAVRDRGANTAAEKPARKRQPLEPLAGGDPSAGGVEAAGGTKFLPAVWSLPHGKIKAPGVYLDDNLVKTGMQHPVHAAKALLAAGPFGVGEAKACLDDLQAHLLSYYGKLFKIEPNLPLEWQLEQLSRNYYPSPVPLSGSLLDDRQPDSVGGGGGSGPQDLAVSKGTLPPPTTPGGGGGVKGIAVAEKDRRDSAKTKINPPTKDDGKGAAAKGDGASRKEKPSAAAAPGGGSKVVSEKAKADAESGTPDGKIKLPGEPEGLTRTATLPTVKRDVSGVMAELLDLAKGNGDRLTQMVREVNEQLGDGSSVSFWRNERMRRDGLACPKYLADAPYVEYLGDLEASVETMYRNLRITAEWNNRKIRLMEDRLKVLNAGDDFRSAL